MYGILLQAGDGQRRRTVSVGSLGEAAAGRLGGGWLGPLRHLGELGQLGLLRWWAGLGRHTLCSKMKQTVAWDCGEHCRHACHLPAQLTIHPVVAMCSSRLWRHVEHQSRFVLASCVVLLLSTPHALQQAP